jgi:hypothetical protein
MNLRLLFLMACFTNISLLAMEQPNASVTINDLPNDVIRYLITSFLRPSADLRARITQESDTLSNPDAESEIRVLLRTVNSLARLNRRFHAFIRNDSLIRNHRMHLHGLYITITNRNRLCDLALSRFERMNDRDESGENEDW